MMFHLDQVQLQEDDLVRAGLFGTGQDHAENPPLSGTPFYAQDQGPQFNLL